MTEIHLSLDIETLGTSPMAPVLSIAVVPFEVTGEEFRVVGDTFHVTCLPDLGVERPDISTIRFWLDQVARGIPCPLNPDAASMAHTLDLLAQYLAPYGPSVKTWANSPSFDCVIIENCYRSRGLVAPTMFRQWLDVRTLRWTLRDYLGIEIKCPKPAVPHDAYYDAIAQAEWVFLMLKRLRSRS